MVNSLKGVSSRRLKRQFPEIERKLWSGGAPLEVVKQHIENQQRPQ